MNANEQRAASMRRYWQDKNTIPVQEAISLRESGMSLKAIADKLGYSERRVNTLLVRVGIHMKRAYGQPKPQRPGRVPPKVNSGTALSLFQQGKTLRQIAEHFPGASRMAVSRAIKRAQQLEAK